MRADNTAFLLGLPGLAGKQRLPEPKRHFGVSIATAPRSLSRLWPTPPRCRARGSIEKNDCAPRSSGCAQGPGGRQA